jgi:hypothetical protein
MERSPSSPPGTEAKLQAEMITFHNKMYHSGKVGSDLEDCSRDSSLPVGYVCPYSKPLSGDDIDEWYKNNWRHLGLGSPSN